MTSVTITETTKAKAVVDVEFPIYRHANYGGDTYESETWYRWDEDGTEWSVNYSEHWNAGTKRWEIERDRQSLTNPGAESADWLLGRGEYKCSAEQFLRALEEAREFMRHIAP